MKLFHSLLAALALLLCTPAFAQPLTPEESAQVDQLVTKTLTATGTPSASIAIVRDNRVVYTKAYGKQSETILTARNAVPYQIASVSKQFTAAAILLLANERKLSLDDVVATYIPGISGGDTITIRQLLTHTSGLQDYWPQDFSLKAMATATGPQGIVDRWAKKPLDFAPGTQWQYSNTGYVVAGMIVEKVSGEPLLSYLDAKIFKPLGIVAINQDLAVGANFPQGYSRAALGPLRQVTPAADGWLFAAGELSMSAADLAKWNIARLTRTILSPEDWAAQETAIKLNDGSATGYGLGVTIGVENGRRRIEHSGEAVGFLTENVVYPDDRTAITVMTNTWSSDAFMTIARGITAIVLPPPPATAADDAALAKVRAVFDQVRKGRPDPALLTEDAVYYFTPQRIADFRDSLLPLGEPKSFELISRPRLRGGFVNRTYRVSYANRALVVSTYAEPGESGRIEQFLVAPAQK